MTDCDNYSENLAFEPEFTWGNLLDWVREFCHSKKMYFELEYDSTMLMIGQVVFEEDGDVSCCECGKILAETRTPRQMQTIIKALYE